MLVLTLGTLYGIFVDKNGITELVYFNRYDNVILAKIKI